MRRIYWIWGGAFVSAAVIEGLDMLLGALLIGVWFPLAYLLTAALRIFLLAKITETAVFLYERHTGQSEERGISRFYLAAGAGVVAADLFALLMPPLFPFLWNAVAGVLLFFFLRIFLFAELADLVLRWRGGKRTDSLL